MRFRHGAETHIPILVSCGFDFFRIVPWRGSKINMGRGIGRPSTPGGCENPHLPWQEARIKEAVAALGPPSPPGRGLG